MVITPRTVRSPTTVISPKNAMGKAKREGGHIFESYDISVGGIENALFAGVKLVLDASSMLHKLNIS